MNLHRARASADLSAGAGPTRTLQAREALSAAGADIATTKKLCLFTLEQGEDQPQLVLERSKLREQLRLYCRDSLDHSGDLYRQATAVSLASLRGCLER